jgi:hypothetical protein
LWVTSTDPADPIDLPERPSLDAMASKVEILSKRIPAMENEDRPEVSASHYDPDYHGLMGEVPGWPGSTAARAFPEWASSLAGRRPVMSEILSMGARRPWTSPPFARPIRSGRGHRALSYADD